MDRKQQRILAVSMWDICEIGRIITHGFNCSYYIKRFLIVKPDDGKLMIAANQFHNNMFENQIVEL